MVTKAEEKSPRVQVPMSALLEQILAGTTAGSEWLQRGVQVIHVLKNGTIKITYNDGGTIHIPMEE
jgi:hypothetical protein